MNYAEQISTDIKEAMKSKDADKLTTLRGVKSGFTNELVASGKTPQDEVSDEMALTVLKRQAKQRKDAIQQFSDAGREELADNEKLELSIIEAYLPATMSQDEIRPIAEAKKEQMGISDKAQMGQLMGAIMGELKDKEVDGGDVKEVVESLFT
jgi:uncharacterized protein YqeY